MKYCEEFAALLDPYVDGELSGEEAARVRAHLESCPGCQAYADGALAIRAAFPEIGETEVPAGFAGGVMAAVRAGEAKRTQSAKRSRRALYWHRALLPLAACFALVLILRAVPGSGSGNASVTAANMAPPAAVMDDAAADTAAPAGDGGVLYRAAPQMDAESSVLPEEVPLAAAPSESGPEEPDAPADAIPGAANDSTAGAVPYSGQLSAPASRAIRLTAAQAGGLLADLPYTAEEDGVRCYQLPNGDFDALLDALAERGIVPPVSEPENFVEGYDLVYVTEE